MSRLILVVVTLASGDEVANPRHLTEFGCLRFEDTHDHALRGVLGPHLESDYCNYQDQTDSVEDIFDACNQFCGKGFIPVPTGVPSFGLNLAEMDQICLGKKVANATDNSGLFGTYDKDLMGKCRLGYQGLELVKGRAANVVKDVELMRLEQMTFRVHMAWAVANVTEVLSSTEWSRNFMSYRNDEKIPKYIENLEALLEDVLHAGNGKRRLENRMQNIADSIASLNTALEAQVPILMEYVENCGSPVLAISTGSQYLLDVCVQNTATCLNDPQYSADAQHVGCCCGTLPATGNFDIPANISTRRLAVSNELSIDVCFEAAQKAQGEVDQLTNELLASTQGQQMLAQYEASLDSKYPTWRGDCSGGVVQNRRLDENVNGAPAAGHRLAARDILTTCTPPAAATIETGETMKVAFSNYTESDYCVDLIAPAGHTFKTVDLADQCTQFCGAEAVPLLVGSTAFGFNHAEMDAVCINSSIVKTDHAKLRQCLLDSEAMGDVDKKMSAFITSVQKVELAKLEYETEVTAQLPQIKEAINERAEAVLKGARADKKADVYADFLRNEVFQSVTGTSQAALKYKDSLNRLKATVESLQTTVRKSLASYADFLENCSDMFTGRGILDEYLLDMCSQTSTECIESDYGKHAGCCCGYTPFMAVGQENINFASNIPGIDAEGLSDNSGGARVSSRRLYPNGGSADRRLESSITYFNICGSVWEDSDIFDTLGGFHSSIGDTREVYEEWVQDMKERYPDAKLCLYEAPESQAPTGAPTNKPSISPSTGPTDGPTTGSPTTSGPTTDAPSTAGPTQQPTGAPTTTGPTSSPTGAPTNTPSTIQPTDMPTTDVPTTAPTVEPTNTAAPTNTPAPTNMQTGAPTASDTTQPTQAVPAAFAGSVTFTVDATENQVEQATTNSLAAQFEVPTGSINCQATAVPSPRRLEVPERRLPATAWSVDYSVATTEANVAAVQDKATALQSGTTFKDSLKEKLVEVGVDQSKVDDMTAPTITGAIQATEPPLNEDPITSTAAHATTMKASATILAVTISLAWFKA